MSRYTLCSLDRGVHTALLAGDTMAELITYVETTRLIGTARDGTLSFVIQDHHGETIALFSLVSDTDTRDISSQKRRLGNDLATKIGRVSAAQIALDADPLDKTLAASVSLARGALCDFVVRHGDELNVTMKGVSMRTRDNTDYLRRHNLRNPLTGNPDTDIIPRIRALASQPPEMPDLNHPASICPRCQGYGVLPAKAENELGDTCPKCHGTGKAREPIVTETSGSGYTQGGGIAGNFAPDAGQAIYRARWDDGPDSGEKARPPACQHGQEPQEG